MSNDLSPGGASSLNAAQILAKLTGATALAAGAMLFGAGSALLTTLPASTNGYFLSLVAGAPAWVPSPSAALPVSYVVGDTLYASSTSALSRLAAVAVGQVLISAGVGVAPSWSASPSVTGIITAKPTTTAGIALDPNAATGNFTLSLSPANITAARRWSFPDRSDTVAGLGAQTFTGVQTFTALITITGPSAVPVLNSTAASDPVTSAYLSFQRNAVEKGWIGYGDGVSGIFKITNNIGDIRLAPSGQVIIGADPGGSGLLRINGNVNVSTLVTMSDNALRRNGVTTPGTVDGINIYGPGGEIYMGIPTTGDYRLYIGTAVKLSLSNGLLSIAPNTVIGTDPGGSALLRIGGSLFNSLGTITTTQQAIDSSVTWNSGATAFTGWKLNVTDTASAAGSLLLDLQVGGVSKFNVRKDGLLTLGGLASSGANNGELWFDSSPKTFRFFSGGIQQNITSTIHTGLTASGTGPSNTTTATSLIPAGNGSKTIPANFWQGGSTRAIRITLTGTLSNTGTPTLTLLVKLGSTTIANTGAVTMAANATGQTTLTLTLSQTTTDQVFATLQCLYSVTGGSVISQSVANNAACTLSVAQTIDVTAQFGTASPSNNMLIAVSSIELLG